MYSTLSLYIYIYIYIVHCVEPIVIICVAIDDVAVMRLVDKS